jgi:hypothetical protein
LLHFEPDPEFEYSVNLNKEAWPGKSSGAFGFACPFLSFFLLGKQKKEGTGDIASNQKNGKQKKFLHSPCLTNNKFAAQ